LVELTRVNAVRRAARRKKFADAIERIVLLGIGELLALD